MASSCTASTAIAATITSSSSSNKLATSHTEGEQMDAKVCEHSLRKVFSWLEVPELMCAAALVSQRWAAAAGCKEVFRRRMHRSVLDTLFNPQHIKQHHIIQRTQKQLQQQQQDDCDTSRNNTADQHQQQDTHGSTVSSSDAVAAAAAAAAAAGPTAAAAIAASVALAAAGVGPARLFDVLYGSNLLANGSFLERHNNATHSSGRQGALQMNAAAAGHRTLVWEPTLNPRGTTWAHPFDFFPELCPLLLPDEAGAGAGVSGSSSSSSRRGAAAAAAAAKPFSVGCLATAGGMWSEVVQVVDLQAVLVSSGLPQQTSAWLLATAALPMEFSVQVAGGAAAGGEYQIVMALIAAEDAAAAAAAAAAGGDAISSSSSSAAILPLSAVPKLTLPFGHPPPGCPGIEAVSAAQLQARGFSRGTKNLAKAPLHPPPGVWTRYSCRTVLPRDTPISHVVIALRGRASRQSRLGHYATKFADARLAFLSADHQC